MPTVVVMRYIVLLCLLFISGCAQPFEGRVATRLHEAGLPQAMSECMARRWVDKLNVFQLRKIQRLTDDLKRQKSKGRLTVIRLIDRVRQMDDPEIVEVVSTSTVLCSLKV
jgi:hypothetical protein